MQIFSIDPIPVFRASRQLTLGEVGRVSAEVCPSLEAAARAAALETGPWIFAAHGMPRDAETVFSLDFCLAISGSPSPDQPCLPAFRCAVHHYRGALVGLFSEGYRPLLDAVAQAGLTTTGHSREVYHRWTEPSAADNHIEIQIGIR